MKLTIDLQRGLAERSSPPLTGTERGAGPAIAAFLTDQLTEERSRKVSLENRAIGVITTSGALVTLLFGLAALVTSGDAFFLPVAARVALMLALVPFILAAVLAVVIASPAVYREATVESMRKLAAPDVWLAPAAEAGPKIADITVRIIDGARHANGRKATLLRWAAWAEVLGTGTVGAAVFVVLIHG
jgi:hypothetical protein